MAHYIDKDALVAEIEKWLGETDKGFPNDHNLGRFDAYERTLSFIDTLEVKEVDFEREMQAFAKINLEPLVISDSNIGISITMSQLYNCAKHFFELGLKVSQKEVDLELITGWFDHIAQIADDRMTLTNQRMTDAHALDEIKCLAKNSSEFIQRHYKAQKGDNV